MSRSITIAIPITVASCLVLAAQTGSHEARAKDIFKQLVEINTTHSVGDTTKAAEANLLQQFRSPQPQPVRQVA